MDRSAAHDPLHRNKQIINNTNAKTQRSAEDQAYPRKPGDGLLRVYPSAPERPDWAALRELAERVKARL